MSMSKITPFLIFPSPQALHAAEFYVSLFNSSPGGATTQKPKSAIIRTTKLPSSSQPADDDKKPDDKDDAGSILTVDFQLAGQSFVALNGGGKGGSTEMAFKFNESVSFQITCETQEEIDHFWNGFTATVQPNGGGDGAKGQESYCGWCKDPWGVSWQVTPTRLAQLMDDSDPEAKGRVAKKLNTMRKLDLAALEAAAKGE